MIFFEIRVHEAVLTHVVPSLVKIIHIQLSHEWREVVVLEKLRQDLISEFIWLSYYKSVAIFVPTYNMITGGVLYNLNTRGPYINNVVSFNQERGNIC